jgi:hypothetical protein
MFYCENIGLMLANARGPLLKETHAKKTAQEGRAGPKPI